MRSCIVGWRICRIYVWSLRRADRTPRCHAWHYLMKVHEENTAAVITRWQSNYHYFQKVLCYHISQINDFPHGFCGAASHYLKKQKLCWFPQNRIFIPLFTSSHRKAWRELSAKTAALQASAPFIITKGRVFLHALYEKWSIHGQAKDAHYRSEKLVELILHNVGSLKFNSCFTAS